MGDGEGVHPTQVGEVAGVAGDRGGERGLGVGVGAEVTGRDLAQVGVVVDLPVDHGPVAVPGRQRLGAVVEVDDGQPGVPEPGGTHRAGAGAVRAAVPQPVQHPSPEHLVGVLSRVGLVDHDDAAHLRQSRDRRARACRARACRSRACRARASRVGPAGPATGCGRCRLGCGSIVVGFSGDRPDRARDREHLGPRGAGRGRRRAGGRGAGGSGGDGRGGGRAPWGRHAPARPGRHRHRQVAGLPRAGAAARRAGSWSPPPRWRCSTSWSSATSRALVEAVGDLPGVDASYAVLKGRSNYACLHRIREGVPDDQGALIEVPAGLDGRQGARAARLGRGGGRGPRQR